MNGILELQKLETENRGNDSGGWSTFSIMDCQNGNG